MASEFTVWRLVSRCGRRGPRTWNRGVNQLLFFFRSFSALKEFALGTTLAEVAFQKEKEKKKPYDTKDKKIHDFGGGNNDIHFIRVLSNP